MPNPTGSSSTGPIPTGPGSTGPNPTGPRSTGPTATGLSHRRSPLLLVAAWLALAPATGLGAEGHYSVEEADLLPKGSCRLSGWTNRGLRNPYRGAVVSPQCGLGPIELEMEFGRQRDGVEREWSSPQSLTIKWGRQLAPTLQGAVHVEFESDDGARSLEQTRFTLPLTWRPGGGLTTHLNVGRELLQHGRNRNSGGIAIEWAINERWSMLAERFHLEGTWATRAGIRRRIGYGEKIEASHEWDFLMEFYRQQRDFLESRNLFGEMREDKFHAKGPARP